MRLWICRRLVTIGILLALGGHAFARASACSTRSLVGNYGFTISGEILPAPGVVVPVVGVAMTHFDGRGNLSQVDFVMRNGSHSGGDEFSTDETGTYTVDSDCTGSAVINFPDGSEIDLKLVIVNHGREIHTVVSALKIPTGQTLPSAIRSDAVRTSDREDDD